MRSPKETLLAWVKAMNDHDAEAGAALYHEEAVNLQVATNAPLAGREAIRADLAAFFAATPDTVTRIENLFEDGEWAILEWSGGGTFVGAPGLEMEKPQPYAMQGCGFFHVVDGLIIFQRGYWDRLSWLSQLGLAREQPMIR
ncbi:MAG TPA: nuclear transport factor 2 family protein [Herpetosiphonaceae bacterium]